MSERKRYPWNWKRLSSFAIGNDPGAHMPQNLSQKLINSHLVEGVMTEGTPITLKIDQTLTQDATGTLAMLSLEAIGLDRVST